MNKPPKKIALKILKTNIARPTNPTYLYKAKVKDVVDGDTLILQIDLGFYVWKEQRVRLAQINCPEMDSKEGKKAFEYLKKKMLKTDFVMIQTNKIDLYGRYVGHIFYDPESSNAKKTTKKKTGDEIFKSGTYLNQELVEMGLAVMFK